MNQNGRDFILRTLRWAAVAVMAPALLPLGPLDVSGQSAGSQHLVKIGDPAPDFTMTYSDGRQQQLSQLKGKVVMLEFTASWCGVCRKEMPFIEREIWQKHKNRADFVLVGIDLREGKKEIDKIVSATGITYPVLLDPDGAIFERYAEKGAGVTRNIVVGRDGKIAFLTRLFERKEFDAMKARIEELLGISGQ